ncbi:kinase-like domain-containing protein [Macrophomina phaseolina]|uniref:Kinase-like domain-containing protein n=1 Tax=Macrophomina phaseolina TaxID=35725 RepID=A0ABQ8GR05_9PEZI|nr:kinase-like domain-containing protein [Macrophomina phaseolina]
MAEAEAMRFVASRASIPVPHVYEAYEKEGIGYIFMSKVEGQTLVKVWKTLSEDDRAVVVNQLRGCVLPLRDLRGEFYGALWNRPCEDIFFHHLCIAKPEDQKYKHYKSRKEYNEGLVQAFHNSCPTGSLSNTDKNLAQDIITLDEECKIFSHGDFHLYNILVDESLSVTGIIDWQGAGFSINEWDYLEAMLIARNPAWIQASAEIFPKESQVHYKTFNAFNQALVAYSGF